MTVASQMIIDHEKEIENSTQKITEQENRIGDNKIKKREILDKVCGHELKKDICSEKDEVYKNHSINGFIKILYNKKRE